MLAAEFFATGSTVTLRANPPLFQFKSLKGNGLTSVYYFTPLDTDTDAESRNLCRIPCNTVQHRATRSHASYYPARFVMVASKNIFIQQETFGSVLASSNQMR